MGERERVLKELEDWWDDFFESIQEPSKWVNKETGKVYRWEGWSEWIKYKKKKGI